MAKSLLTSLFPLFAQKHGDRPSLGSLVGTETTHATLRGLARAGDADAINKLGVLYFHGEGVGQDKTRSYELHRYAAEKGNVHAMTNLAGILATGDGAEVDVDAAVDWYRRAAEAGETRARLTAALLLENHGRMDEANALCEIAWRENADHDCALNYATNLLNHGDGKADREKAFAILSQVIEEGSPDQVGAAFYVMGKETEKTDEATAAGYFLEGAKTGSTQAAVALHKLNRDMLKENEEAIREALRAKAEAGDINAAAVMALLGANHIQTLFGGGAGPLLGFLGNVRQAGAERQDSSATVTESPADEALDTVLAEFDALVGLETVKEQIRTLIAVARVNKKRKDLGLKIRPAALHLALSGPPGTGKTTVARMIGRLYKAAGLLPKGHVVETNREGLVAEYTGQTAPKTKAVIAKAKGGVLFIDEVDQLVSEAYTRGDIFGEEALGQLMKQMEDERDGFAVVIATHTDGMKRFLACNPGLASRFKTVLSLPEYPVEALTEIFRRMAEADGYRLAEGTMDAAERVIKALHNKRSANWGNAREVRNLFEDSLQRQAIRLDRIGAEDAETLTTLLPEDLTDRPKAPATVAKRTARDVLDLDSEDGRLAFVASLKNRAANQVLATIDQDEDEHLLTVRHRGGAVIVVARADARATLVEAYKACLPTAFLAHG